MPRLTVRAQPTYHNSSELAICGVGQDGRFFYRAWQFLAAIYALYRRRRKEMSQTGSPAAIFSRRWIIWLTWRTE